MPPTPDVGARPRRDRGSAMIIVVSMVVLVTALAAIGTSVAISDQSGSNQSQKAGRALNAAEAGVSQAVNYIRANGTRKLKCNLTTCPTNAWSEQNPVTANVAAGAKWTAWIKPLSVGDPADGDSDTYLVRSTGSAGGPAERVVETEVTVSPIGLPMGIFGRTINLGGTVDIRQISMFSTGCVYKRGKVEVDFPLEFDAAYNVPSAVHSSQIITTSQGTGQYCPNTAQPIHRTNVGNLSLPLFCNTAYPHDQDRLGGSLTSSPLCLNQVLGNPSYLARDLDGDNLPDIDGSFIRDERAMLKAFGIKRPALTDAQIEQLKVTAQAQGNYHTATNTWNGTVNGNHAVLFFDVGTNATVDLSPLGSSMWARARIMNVADPLCIDASLLVVVQGGNAKMDSNMNLAAAVYMAGGAPGGRLTKGNGTVNHVGMLYADTLDFTGNIGISLDSCYMANPHPGLFDVSAGSYRELDRSTTS